MKVSSREDPFRPENMDIFAAHARAVEAVRDNDLRLALDTIYKPDCSPWQVPAYRFDMLVCDAKAGTISLRVGDNDRLVRYAGQVGYSVDQPYRGRRLAERATRLLFPLARSHGLNPLWIGCNPDNLASRRVIERLGGVFVELVELPADYDRYISRGETHKLRFRIDLDEVSSSAPSA